MFIIIRLLSKILRDDYRTYVLLLELMFCFWNYGSAKKVGIERLFDTVK